MCKIFVTPYSFMTKALICLSPIFLIALRIILFNDFFLEAGLAKLNDWQSTLTLFKYEYNVPFLPPEFAAYLGTGTELLLPLMLLVGLFSRFAAVGLFIFNVVAVYSYPFLWTADGAVGFNDHVSWGIYVAVIMIFGPSKFSIDELLHRKCENYQY